MQKKLLKIYVTYYSLLIVQHLWQDHYQILSMKLAELNISIATVFLNTQTLKII